MLLASLMGALAIVLLSGCASDPTSTSEDIAPPEATATKANVASPSTTAIATPTLSDPVPTPEDGASPSATPTDATPDSSGDAATPPLMDIAASDARHFKGDPDAPVTIVEFGDFQ
jgi:hypothetical protein